MKACAVAAAATCALGGAFVAPPVSAAQPQTVSLRGAAQSGASAGSFAATATLSAAAVVAVSAGVARRQRSCIAQKSFAGGLSGTKYADYFMEENEFDPLDLAERYPQHLAWYRESELKHGRIAMFAFLGCLVQDSGFRLPFAETQDSSITLINAHSKLLAGGVGFGPMWWLLAVVGAIESLRFRQLGLGFEKLTLENAGDLDFGKAFFPKTAEGQEQLKTKELKNGRLAMLAVGGILTQAELWHSESFPWAPYH